MIKILEKKALTNKLWTLAKLNIDQVPRIASSLEINTVPITCLLKGNNIYDGFEGCKIQDINIFFETV